MIKIKVLVDCKDEPILIKVSGHANYNKKGKDIVCAAVSAVTIGMVNSIEEIFDIKIYTVGKDYITCTLPVNLEEKLYESIKLIFKCLLSTLTGIANEYPKYVQINLNREE